MARILKKYSPDFTKLQIKFTSKIQKGWAGDWSTKTNLIKIHRSLNNVDRHGVIIHEFIEMMVTSLMRIPGYPHPEYKQRIHGKKNQEAHDYANKIEKEILEMTGNDWEQHEKRVNKVRFKKAE
jgi:hypothetical protein